MILPDESFNANIVASLRAFTKRSIALLFLVATVATGGSMIELVLKEVCWDSSSTDAILYIIIYNIWLIIKQKYDTSLKI